MSGESKPYTTVTEESMAKFAEGWDAIFNKKNKLKKKKDGIRKRSNKPRGAGSI